MTVKQQEGTRQDESSSTDASLVSAEKSDESSLSFPILTANGNDYTWDMFFESMVKISMCAFGGSLVGLAQQRKMNEIEAFGVSAGGGTSSAVTSMNGVVESGSVSPRENSQPDLGNKKKRRRMLPVRRGPPSKTISKGQSTIAASLPGKWAISCMFFALILESSRTASPTNFILRIIQNENDEKQEGSEKTGASHSSSNASVLDQEAIKRCAITSFGDYAVGGMVAGLAGSLATIRSSSNLSSTIGNTMAVPQSLSRASSPGIILWGLGAGVTLGMLAGLIQAGVDAGNLYLELEGQKELHEEKEKEQL